MRIFVPYSDIHKVTEKFIHVDNHYLNTNCARLLSLRGLESKLRSLNSKEATLICQLLSPCPLSSSV